MGGRYATHKGAFDKTEGRQYYWIVQSFDNEHGEQSYNAEDVHEMEQGTGRSVCEKRVSSCS